MASLRRPYPRIIGPEGASCGGNQNWFSSKNFRRCGCGVIACADTLLYLSGRQEMNREAYLSYVEGLKKYFPLIPGRGIDGLRLALGMDLLLRREDRGLHARWCASGKRFWPRVEELLSADRPAILSVGPSLPRLWSGETVGLYSRKTDAAPAERTRAHFLTAIALDGEWVEVSSWGRRLYIRRKELDAYRSGPGAPLLTNLLYLTDKK